MSEKDVVNSEALSAIQRKLQDDSIVQISNIQSLWSNYGEIVRLQSKKTGQFYVVKLVAAAQPSEHPRGWNTLTGHERKVKSYQVESHFYQHYAQLTRPNCRVPAFIARTQFQHGSLLIMEDLDAAGFGVRKSQVSLSELAHAVTWLANFHARFMGNQGMGLWPIGTYWHLATRQDEWQAMPEGDLKRYAKRLDDALTGAGFQTLVHGDAKLANLCFHQSKETIAVVDFQYVGRGPGVKDLAYLLGSVLDNDGLNAHAETLLNHYISRLIKALEDDNVCFESNKLEAEIRHLYPVAWADFYRFLLGWNPQSWKVCSYMKAMADTGLANICE